MTNYKHIQGFTSLHLYNLYDSLILKKILFIGLPTLMKFLPITTLEQQVMQMTKTSSHTIQSFVYSFSHTIYIALAVAYEYYINEWTTNVDDQNTHSNHLSSLLQLVAT